MRELSTREKRIWAVLAALLLAAVVYACERLLINGVFAWELVQPEFLEMAAELAALFAAFFLIGRFTSGWKRAAGIGTVLAVFLWVHVILLPLLVSGLYLLYLCSAGRRIRGLLRRGAGASRPSGEVPEMGSGGGAADSRPAGEVSEARSADEAEIPRPSGEAADSRPADRTWGAWFAGQCRNFLVGCLAVICLFCLMSAVGLGSVPQLSAAVVLSAGMMFGWDLRKWFRGGRKNPMQGLFPERAWSTGLALGAAFLLTMFCLQAGRMNISVDFDSIWYGVRGAYILDNGRGIYEDLGTVSVVYTYPKGWETLTLPLVLLPSYSFQISFNLWLTAGAIWAACRVAGRFMDRKMVFYLAVFLASVPGITNMGITAKTDAVTLFVQLIMMNELMTCAAGTDSGGGGRKRGLDGSRERTAAGVNGGGDRTAFFYGTAALLLSWTCKPTALVFSTAVFGMSILYLLCAGRLLRRTGRENRPRGAADQMEGGVDLQRGGRGEQPHARADQQSGRGSIRTDRKGLPRGAADQMEGGVDLQRGGRGEQSRARADRLEIAGLMALALGGLAGIWARTWLLTGLPVTSIFSSIFTRLGFQMKYPYNAQPVPDMPGGMSWPQKLAHMGARLYGILLDPSRLDHVLIAWGSLIFCFALCAAAAGSWLPKRTPVPKERRLGGWFSAVYFPFLAVNIYSLFRLQQVDGNYFMLLYVLTGILAFRMISGIAGKSARRAMAALALPVVAFSAVFTALTNWSWSVGLTPVNLINRGYYDQLELRHEEMAEEGKGTIWAIVAEDPRNRLIVFGSHPEDLAFPCSAQSVTDISGADGNLRLTSGKTYFREFMEYAKTDYVYVNATWVADRMWAWTLLDDLVEYGYLEPVLYEKDNMLAKARPDGKMTGESEKMARDFRSWRNAWLGF